MKKVLIAIVLVAAVCGVLYFKDDIFKDKMVELGYSKTSSDKIKELDIKDSLNDTYYKTLDIALTNNEFAEEYINNYMKIDYNDNEYFIDCINKLLKENYSDTEINDMTYIFDSPYFKENNLLRYASYIKENPEIDKEKTVIYVNIGLDQEFYTNISEIKDPNNLLVLVNKFNKLPEDYAPTDLATFDNKYTISSSKRQMRKVAYEALITMIDDINDKGMNLWLNSGLRTRAYQNTLFTNSTSRNGLEHALKYSAKPRHSEHETGLAADISSVKGMLDGFENYKEYTWLKENAYKYGFIERYPKGKENITGYEYEPWHYRYVGVDVATIIKNENITFEEYYVKYLNY